MRIVAYGLALCVFLILTAKVLAAQGGQLVMSDAVPFPMDMYSQILQGGALAVLGWTVWYMLAKAFPAHIVATKEQRDAFLAALHSEKEETQIERREVRCLISELVGMLRGMDENTKHILDKANLPV